MSLEHQKNLDQSKPDLCPNSEPSLVPVEEKADEFKVKEKISDSTKQFKSPLIDAQTYRLMYEKSIHYPEQFWSEQSELITWFSPWEKVFEGDFKNFNMQWFLEGKLNACYNCLDRHLELNADQTALIWESDDGKNSKYISYKQLHEQVCKFANVLKKQGVKKGDRVCIYLPMIPEIIVSMLACARIGAVHSVVFAGFSSEALKTRIQNLNSKLIITADESIRGGKITSCKVNTDNAIKEIPFVKKVIVVKRTSNSIPWDEKRDLWYHEILKEVDAECSAELMDSDDPLFILYTSGSTGQPKGILHTVGGYLVYVTMSFKYIFNYQQGDIHFCTADLGWITGHSYLLYGPLTNGATTLLFEGSPNYPTFSRYWDIVDKYQVNIFYTAPTAIRALRHEGDKWLKETKRKSLKLLGSVGEPIDPEDWKWYYQVVGRGKCPIVDTWWQTETGGIMISSFPGATALKPGSAAWPFFGIEPEVLNEKNQVIKNNQSGKLVIKSPWPGMMKTIYKDKKRFKETYFKRSSGKYLTGDSAYRDGEGYFWIIGRNDDVIKIAGHRIGTGEIENALLSSAYVSEAAVTTIPDKIKGHAIYAFVKPKLKTNASKDLKSKLIKIVREIIGPIANVAHIQWVTELPKTRSGKIMRRILQKIATEEFEDLGDISTLANPEIVDDLIKIKLSNN